MWKYMGGVRHIFSMTTFLSILGMALGVASLVVAMAVVSGFETTLKRSVIDVVGHVIVYKERRGISDVDALIGRIKKDISGVEAYTPFLMAEGVMAHQKKIAGVLLQGLDSGTVFDVLRIEKRLIKGKFDFTKDEDGIAGAVVGKGIAQKFSLKVGDRFKVVLPNLKVGDLTVGSRKLVTLNVRGVVDLGRHDYDSKTVFTDLLTVQEFSQSQKNVTGLRLRLSSDHIAGQKRFEIINKLGSPYWASDWHDFNRNLFEAARLEKIIIFFVLLVMIVAACVNITSTLFVSVVQKFRDISVLKTLGASRFFVAQIFSLQGLLIGIIGCGLGMLIGFGACYGFMYMQEYWGVVPGEVYKLNRIEVEFRLWDFVSIFVASVGICFLSTLAPAWRGAKLNAVEGLRYD